ncbi:Tyrosyl-DNA phosphodiesterase 1 (Partial), partial [Seminavis robusta]
LVVTSHNISRPAWGTISTKNGQKYLHVKSWELGVFVSPDTVGVKKLVPFVDGNQAPGTATVPMPFQTQALERYSDKDEPWAWDKTYDTPDREGYHSLQEAMNEPHE